MTVSATGGTTTPQAQSNSASASAAASLSGNFDTFLKLLTTQMQNQDPLNPMDSAQFTQQLVQYSGVEQAIKTNTNLENLISLTQSTGLNSAMGYLGKELDIDSPQTSLTNGSATWNYSLASDAKDTSLVVKDANGNVVYKTTGATGVGDHAFTWDGKNANGVQLSDGIYSLSVSATTAGNTDVASSVTLKGKVSDVNVVNGLPVLSVNGVPVDESKILAIHEPSTTTQS